MKTKVSTSCASNKKKMLKITSETELRINNENL